MVKPYKYTDSQLITQLIDGELHGEEKSYILARLNSDNNLKHQYKLESAIHKAAQAKPKPEPSEKMTNDLFDKLGFSNTNNEKPFIPWVSTLKRASAFVAAGLVITLIGIYTFSSLNNTKQSKPKTITEKRIPFVSSTSIGDNSATAPKTSINGNLTDDKQCSSSKESKKTKKADRVSKHNSDINEQHNGDYTLRTQDNTDDNSLVSKSQSNIGTNEDWTLQEITASKLYYGTYNGGNFSGNQGSFILQLNPFKYRSAFMNQVNRNNEISVKCMNPQRTTNFMTNGGLAVTYYRKWKGGFKVGVEGGIENINRWTMNAQSNSKEMTNSQALSLSGILRYDAEFIKYGNITPFVQSFAGFGTNFNYVYGGTVGLVYNPPLTRFGIQAGYEYRKFDYYFGSDNTTTMSFSKQGPVVSLIIKF